MSDALYRGRHRAPAGRHRAPTDPSSHGLPGLGGSGYLLPTAAAATLVLTATGAHLGGWIGPTTATAQASGLTAVSAAGSTATEDAIARSDQQRVARGDTRLATDAIPSSESLTNEENARLEAQAAANDAATAKAQVDAAAAKAQADADSAAAEASQATATQAAVHAWVAPVAASYALTSGFGMRWGAMHPGQDFAVPVGTPVKALSSGTVILAGWSGGYGNKVEIQYWDGTVSWFAHNSRLLVTTGEKVTPGETVSMSGSTGHSTGPHLHLEIHPGDGDAIAPLPWLKAKGIMP